METAQTTCPVPALPSARLGSADLLVCWPCPSRALSRTALTALSPTHPGTSAGPGQREPRVFWSSWFPSPGPSTHQMQALRTMGTEGSFLDHTPLPSSPGAQEGGQLRAMLSDLSWPNVKQAILKGGEFPVMGNMQE